MYKLIFVLLCSLKSAWLMEEKTSMYMKQSQVSDQSMSGSGYSYNADLGKPQEYSFELGDTDQDFKVFHDLGYDPFAESQRYAEANLPLPYEKFPKEYSSAGSPVTFLNANDFKAPEAKVQVATPYPRINEYKKLGIYPPAYPYAPGYQHANTKDFLKKLGKLYGDIATAKRGEKVNTSYKTNDQFSKGLSGKYDNQDAKSFFGLNGGKKHLLFDNAGNYAVKLANGKVSAGGAFGQKDYHNNGSKTTGYHKVYHKDDYNKQHKFYDKADKSGHFNKYGDFNAQQGGGLGYFANGANENKGYQANKFGISDTSDKGKFEEIAKGFRNSNGNEAFYQNYDGFSKKGGQEGGSLGSYKI